MIIKEKMAPLFKGGTVFPKSFTVEPSWLHFFVISIVYVVQDTGAWPVMVLLDP